ADHLRPWPSAGRRTCRPPGHEQHRVRCGGPGRARRGDGVARRRGRVAVAAGRRLADDRHGVDARGRAGRGDSRADL
ncbi:MAG: hypothetical protein AVDCRST_MAG52-11, partial [uncultured Blastococcus sp.]